ncbi:MAG: carbon storage regulator [Deltaproteobacteria bacterium]
MLVLSRKLGETITIDGQIKVEVLGVSGNRVRLGVSAPDDCRIFRAEKSSPHKPKVATTLAGSGI